MRAIVATIIDGVVCAPTADGDTRSWPTREANTERAVAKIETVARAVPPISPVEECVAALARVVKLAQGMTPNDQRKMRDYVEATVRAMPAAVLAGVAEQRIDTGANDRPVAGVVVQHDFACGWHASPTLLRFRALIRNSHAGREAISFMGDCAAGNRLDYFRRAFRSNRG